MVRLCKWKQDERFITLLKAVVFALLPLACCLVYCAIQGYQVSDIYLPSSKGSEWNDELFYYKQVEGILEYGYPMGYFGFNESHALKLSFAAWSPVLVFPWVIWGVLFGWNLMSPIVCNIVLMSLACFLFALLVKPTGKQLLFGALLFGLYTPLIRFMLSGMAEISCAGMLVIFYSVAFNYLHDKKRYKLFFLFLFSGVMTLMRPYLVVFVFFPGVFWIYDAPHKKKRVLSFLLFTATVMGMYALINYYLGAEYFEPLFSTDWISAFFSQGLFGGFLFTIKKLYGNGRVFIAYILEAFRSGMYMGILYAGCVICLAMLLLQVFKDLGGGTFMENDPKHRE